MTEDSKKCTNCTRGLQPLDQFIGARGYPVATCAKCREKGKKGDSRPERQEYHTELQKARGAGYSKKSTEKMKSDPPPPEHNLEQMCQWAQSEKARDRINTWKKLNIHDRISSSKRQAIAKGLEWHLTDEEAGKMLTSPCVYCKHIDLEVRVNGIDRLDSNVCYTTENCRPCCKDCNYMKGTYDPNTFIERAKKIAMCDAEFPEVPMCEEHKKINRTPRAKEQEIPTTP